MFDIFNEKDMVHCIFWIEYLIGTLEWTNDALTLNVGKKLYLKNKNLEKK